MRPRSCRGSESETRSRPFRPRWSTWSKTTAQSTACSACCRWCVLQSPRVQPWPAAMVPFHTNALSRMAALQPKPPPLTLATSTVQENAALRSFIDSTAAAAAVKARGAEEEHKSHPIANLGTLRTTAARSILLGRLSRLRSAWLCLQAASCQPQHVRRRRRSVCRSHRCSRRSASSSRPQASSARPPLPLLLCEPEL